MRLVRPLFLAALLAPAFVRAAPPAPPAAVQQKELGDQKKAAGDAAGAIAAYRQALALFPQYAEAYEAMGEVYFSQSQLADALTTFKYATQMDPGYALAWYNLGYVARKAGKLGDARAAFIKYTQVKPDDPDGFFRLAEVLQEDGEKDGAIQYYEAFLARAHGPEFDKRVAKANEAVAALRAPPAQQPAPQPEPQPQPQPQPQVTQPAPQPQQQPQPQPAPQQQPAPQAPGSPYANQIALGDSYSRGGDFRNALVAYQQAATIDPRSAEARFKLGLMYARLDYLNEAVTQWQYALQLDPSLTAARTNIDRAKAKLAAAQSQPQPAAQPQPAQQPAQPVVVQAQPQVNAAAAQQRYDQAVQLINQRLYKDALPLLDDALRQNPRFSLAYMARAGARIGLAQYQGAVDDYKIAQSLDSSMATPLFGLAECYRAMGDRKTAAGYYAQYAASRAADVRDELRAEAQRRSVELSTP